MRNDDPATQAEHPSTTSTGSRWPRRIFKLLLICIPLLAALAVLPPALMILRAIVRPVPPPDAKPALERLLRRGETKPSLRAGRTSFHKVQDGGGIKAMNDESTRPQAGDLRFEAFLSDTPDIPEKLRPGRDQINTDFDRLLREIEEYSLTVDKLNNAQARKRLDQISDHWHRFQQELKRIENPPGSVKGELAQARARYQDCLDWLCAANIENYIKTGRWFEAGCEAEDQWRWKDAFPARRPRDWDRAVYYFWKAGGRERYRSSVRLVWERLHLIAHPQRQG
jgi:hypothetical protein